MEEFTMTYPKVELHCHMDGAIPNRLFVKYCREDGLLDETISDEEWIRKHVMSETMTLSECMGEFALLTNLLQSEERLEELSFELLKDMYESGTKLVELRFSPQSHVNDHMTMEQAVQAVLRGRKKALETRPGPSCWPENTRKTALSASIWQVMNVPHRSKAMHRSLNWQNASASTTPSTPVNRAMRPMWPLPSPWTAAV